MKTRVLTAVVLIPLVLAVVGCTNPWPLAILSIALIALAEAELAGLFKEGPQSWALGSAVSFGILVFSLLLLPTPESPSASVVGLLAGAYVLGLVCAIPFLRGRKSRLSEAGISFTIIIPITGLLFIGGKWATSTWNWSLATPLLLVLLPVWAGDIAAMLGGKAFGKHLMAPTISPKKTWEGAICNFIASLLVGWGVGAWLGYETWVGFACGGAVGVFGQLGDLFESALKRAAGVKDSGSLLPGHGGLLDRIDAMLGSVIPVWLILHFSGSLG